MYPFLSFKRYIINYTNFMFFLISDTHALVEVIEPGCPTSVVALWRIIEKDDLPYDSPCTVLWEDKKTYDCILLFSGMS